VPKKKEERYTVAGKRLKIARTVMDKTQESILEEARWEIVGIIDTKTIGVWEREGVPENKLKKLADFLNVPQFLLVNHKIEDEAFREIVELRKADPNANIDHLISSKSGKDGLEGLVDEIEAPNLPLPYENLEVPWDWDEVISNAHDEGELHFYLGSKCSEEEKYDQAIFNLDKSIAAKTLDGDLLWEAYYARGYSWYKKDNLRKALEDYIKSLAPQLVEAPVPLVYNTVLDRPYHKIRFQWYNENGSAETIADFDELIGNFPENGMVYYLRARKSLGLEKYDSALDDINSAIEMEPESAHIDDFHNVRGYVFYQKGVYSSAIEDFTRVVQKDTLVRPEAVYYRALAYEKENRIDDAIQDIEKCLQFDPNSEHFLEKFSVLNKLP
jgi:tetratricopeptide (TPR) repeat protein